MLQLGTKFNNFQQDCPCQNKHAIFARWLLHETVLSVGLTSSWNDEVVMTTLFVKVSTPGVWRLLTPHTVHSWGELKLPMGGAEQNGAFQGHRTHL
jgi:hypothetical protein